MSSIKVSQLAVECTARPAGENKIKKQLCNVFRGSNERFWMSSGLFIYLPDISVCSRGASDNDVGDWVTSERSGFEASVTLGNTRQGNPSSRYIDSKDQFYGSLCFLSYAEAMQEFPLVHLLKRLYHISIGGLNDQCSERSLVLCCGP